MGPESGLLFGPDSEIGPTFKDNITTQTSQMLILGQANDRAPQNKVLKVGLADPKPDGVGKITKN